MSDRLASTVATVKAAHRKPDEIHLRLAKRLRELARKRKWSANQLADFSGIGRGYLSDVLNGRKSPTVRTLARIADGLEVEVRDLFD